MDVDDLRIVAAVAKHGSMNRAATELHMVQSSVTARIRTLEQELGVRLFVRHSRGVHPSDAGARLLTYSGRIQSLLHEAIAAVQEDGTPKGSLHIGSTEPTVSMRLPSVIAGFAAAYPAVDLTITTGNSGDLVQQVVDQQLDGAFVVGGVNHPDLLSEPLFHDELVVVTNASVTHLDSLAHGAPIRAIVLDQGCSYRDLLFDALRARNIAHQLFPLATFDAIHRCVQAGLGVTLLPRAIYDRTWQDGSTRAHNLDEFATPISTVFIRRKDTQQASGVNAFLLRSRAAAHSALEA